MIKISRRTMLRHAAAGVGLAWAPSWWAADSANPPNRDGKNGFKIGAVDWELTKAGDPEALKVAARLGFDGLQVDLGDVVSMQKTDRQKRYQALAKELNIEIASLAMGVLSEAPYGRTEKSQTLVNTAIDIAQAMRQKLILLAFFGKNDFSQKENSNDALIGRLKEIAPKAHQAGVVLGLEAETSEERYRQIIDGVGSPAVKVYFDCVHAHGAGRDIAEEIKLLGDRICEFHAKDYGDILFGKGKIDWPQVRRGMDAIGYRGWIQVEQWGEINGAKPLGFEETHRRNLKYLRGIFPSRI